MQFQNIFEQAATSTNNVEASGVGEKGRAKKDPNKLDYAVSQGIKNLQASIRLHDQEKSKKSKGPAKKKMDANTTFEEAQDDPELFGKRDKLVHKKWTSLDKKVQWDMIKAYLDQNPLEHPLEQDRVKLLSLLKEGNIKPEHIVYDHKEAKIVKLNV